MGFALISVFVAVKRHCDYSNSYKGKHLIGQLTFPEIQSIIIMVGHSTLMADMVLEKDLSLEKELHFGPAVNGKQSEILGMA